MEIERKYLIQTLPENLDSYPFHLIEQGYLCTNPVLRIRKQDQEHFITYKSKGLLAREEVNLPLSPAGYEHLKGKVDDLLIVKKRILIPLFQELLIELDIFEGKHQGLILAEVEFPTLEEAQSFTPPHWFGADVTLEPQYQNSNLSKHPFVKVS